MRRTLMTLATLIFSFGFLFLNPGQVHGFRIEKAVETFNFADKSGIQTIPRSFCVTEDELFLIPDQQAGKIKIFEKNGESLVLLKKFGPRGTDRDEFNKPAYCFYDKGKYKFYVIDIGVGTKKMYIFDHLKGVDFLLVKSVPGADGYDLKISGDGKHMIISGYVIDNNKNPYELYSINLFEPGQISYLLPSPQKYDLSPEKYKNEYFEKRTLPAIGIKAFIDVQGDDVYFAWEGKMRVLKIDLKTGKQIAAFGEKEKARFYIEPDLSSVNELAEKHRSKDYARVKEEKSKLSFIRDIFATPRHVFVVYEAKQNDFRLQIYTPEGKFIDDIDIPDQGNSDPPYQEMWFDKDSYKLYSLSKAENKEPLLLKYHLVE